MENAGKLRLLYIARILIKQTNDEHMLSTSQIIDILKNEYGISAHRITVTSDIETLQAAGMDICKIESTQNKYFLAERLFQPPELRLLADSIIASGAVTKKKSRDLLEKLCELTDEYTARKLLEPRRNGASKPDNEKIYYIIDKINEAIETDKKIRFCYFGYDEHKLQVLKNNGKEYTFSPYALEMNDEHYYVVGYSEKHGSIVNFRVDRIASVPSITNESRRQAPDGFDVSEHLRASFRMFSGALEEVMLLCTSDMMNTVIDHFGADVSVTPLEDSTFTAKVKIAVSPMFFRWIFGFYGKIRILSPKNVKDQYADMVRRAAELL